MSESKPDQNDYGLQFSTNVQVDDKTGLYYVSAIFGMGLITSSIHVPVNGVPGFVSAFRKGMLDTMRDAIRMEVEAGKVVTGELWTP